MEATEHLIPVGEDGQRLHGAVSLTDLFDGIEVLKMTKTKATALGGVVPFSRLGPIEYRDPNSLKRYERNPRKHPKKQMVKLVAAIREFGFAVPVLIAPDGLIIAGEARIEAAKEIGLTEVPVIPLGHLSPAKIKALRLADNRLSELGEWDAKLLALEIEEILLEPEFHIEALGWDAAEIDVLLSSSVAAEPLRSDPADEAVEPPISPISVIRVTEVRSAFDRGDGAKGGR